LRPLLAIVEIGDDPMLLVIGGVFILTFMLACAVAYLLLARGDPSQSGWHLHFQRRLPVSQRTFEQIANATAAAIAKPETSAARRAQLDELGRKRGAFVVVYRTVMIASGLVALTAAVLLLRSHTPANMNGLPGGIVLLISLGLLMNGLIPGPSIVPVVDPLNADLVDQIKNKIKLQVSTAEPLTVALNESQMRLGAEMLSQGVPLADVARAVYANYDNHSETDKRSIEVAVGQCLRTM
jgi:hypothetical protein